MPNGRGGILIAALRTIVRTIKILHFQQQMEYNFHHKVIPKISKSSVDKIDMGSI